MKRLLTTLFALVLIATACGSDNDTVDTGGNDDTPAVAGLCPEDNPDCDDVGAISGDDAPDANDGDGTGDTISPVTGALVDGGLSVPEALATDATGTIAVKGFLFDDGSGLRLCEALAESFPPQCGGESLVFDGFTVDDISNLPQAEDIVVNTEQGVSWTDHSVSLFGELDGDRFTVSNSI